jgi:predicted CoA-binding protein
MKIKVAVVGAAEYFWWHAPYTDNVLEVVFFDYYHGSDEEDCFCRISMFAPDIMLVFRPEIVPKSFLLLAKGPIIAFSSEIFPFSRREGIPSDLKNVAKADFFKCGMGRFPGYVYHYDDSRRTFCLEEGIYFTGYQFLPLNLSLFPNSIAEDERPVDVLFFGRASARRSEIFEGLKQSRLKFIWIEHGLTPQELMPFLTKSKCVVNLTADRTASVEPRILISLFAGCRVLAENTPTAQMFFAGLETNGPLMLDCVRNDNIAALVEDLNARSISRNKIRERLLCHDPLLDANRFVMSCLNSIASGTAVPFFMKTSVSG